MNDRELWVRVFESVMEHEVPYNSYIVGDRVVGKTEYATYTAGEAIKAVPDEEEKK